MTQRTLVVISAGLGLPSSTRLLADRLAAAAVDRAAGLGVDLSVRVADLRDVAHDLMNHLLTGFPAENLRDLLDAVEAADGLIAVTPIFNASYSGLFKSFFDVLGKDVLADKPVLIAATGGTPRHSLALEHAVRPMFAYLRAATVPTPVFAATADWGDEAGGDLRDRIDRAAGELVREIARREPARAGDPFALTTSFEELLAGG